MLGYDYSIVYRKGTQNIVADALSRRPFDSSVQLLQCEGNTEGDWSTVWEQIIVLYEQDMKLSRLIDQVRTQPRRHLKYSWQNNCLRRKGKVVVGNDTSLRKRIFGLFHDTPIGSHSGVHATRHRISALLYWKGLTTDIKQWVRECVICQRCKYDNAVSPRLLQPLPIPERVWADISMDFVEGLPLSQGKSTILVVVDRLTKYGHFLALGHPYTASTVAQEYLTRIYKLHGILESIVTDRDKIFLSQFWQELFKHMGTKLKKSTAYHPQTDGQTEILNKCLEGYLRCMVGEKPSAWASWLPLAEWWYNTTYHSAQLSKQHHMRLCMDKRLHCICLT